MTITNNIYQKQIKYHVFNAVTNSEFTELVPVFTMRPALPTSVKKVNTSFKNVWRTWGPTLLADLMIFCPLGPIAPTNFKNFVFDGIDQKKDKKEDKYVILFDESLIQQLKKKQLNIQAILELSYKFK